MGNKNKINAFPLCSIPDYMLWILDVFQEYENVILTFFLSFFNLDFEMTFPKCFLNFFFPSFF